MQQQVSLDRLSTLATSSEQRIIRLLSENKENFPTDYNGICFVDYTWIFSNNILYGQMGEIYQMRWRVYFYTYIIPVGKPSPNEYLGIKIYLIASETKL